MHDIYIRVGTIIDGGGKAQGQIRHKRSVLRGMPTNGSRAAK
jgi:hypothetical protein